MRMQDSGMRQSGATLLEVLIAVLVLSVGMLGVAALQATALRNSASSYERSQATILSYSLFDAMRADAASAAAYNTAGWLCSAPTGTSLRDRQLADWMGALKTNLGNSANTCVSVEGCGAGGNCVVTVQWDDSKGTGSAPGVLQTIDTVTRL